jgi:hypothetical protein
MVSAASHSHELVDACAGGAVRQLQPESFGAEPSDDGVPPVVVGVSPPLSDVAPLPPAPPQTCGASGIKDSQSLRPQLSQADCQ